MGPTITILTDVLLLYVSLNVFINQVMLQNDVCNSPLGLSSGSIPKESLSAQTESSKATEGRLNNAEGAWCFSNTSIQERLAVFQVDLGESKFVSGFASQGPPITLQPIAYNHLVAFAVFISEDNAQWIEFDKGNLFFNVDKNDTSDGVSYHAATTIQFGRFVKLSVVLLVSGTDIICLRFEIYGCDFKVEPSSDIEATTTTMGKILVKWKQPVAVNTLDERSVSQGTMSPKTYVITYWPLEGVKTIVSSQKQEVLLEDVRLGATYVIESKCSFGDVFVNCGSTRIEAYPPCPLDWSGGNEYHCFLLIPLSVETTFDELKTRCLNDAIQNLGPAGALIDEKEQRFLTSRIIDSDVREVWIIGEKCAKTADCCQHANVEGGTVSLSDCKDERPKYALCIRDHKGEGARLRVSRVVAVEDGSSVVITWRYEGDGWKTDELQMKLWDSDDPDEATQLNYQTFSTLTNTFRVQNLEADTMYYFFLRPAPNIRTLIKENGFVIIEFPDMSPRFGALLTPVPVTINILWNGFLKLLWEEVHVMSEADLNLKRSSERYTVTSRQMAAPDMWTKFEVVAATQLVYELSPVAMETEYKFQIKCFFLDREYLCSETAVKTDSPDLVRRLDGALIVYDVITDIPKNWSRAEADCKGRSGNLMSLLSEKEGKEVLGIFPKRDSLLWIGAQLGRKASGFWTDGTKITDLPMAKTSGVTSNAESCCRALNEAERLRLSGADCADELPYICKYRLGEILDEPDSVQIEVKSWKSIKVSWERPKEHWLPSYSEISACPIINGDLEAVASCKANDAVTVSQNINFVTFDRLEEFTEYEVTVRASLKPFQEEKTKALKTMTYPKNDIWYTMSPKGVLTLKIARLIAQGHVDAAVTANLKDLKTLLLTSIPGSAQSVTVDKLIPGRQYELAVFADDLEWNDHIEIEAVPTCNRGDLSQNFKCYKVVQQQRPYEESLSFCNGDGFSLWRPRNVDDIKSVLAILPDENVYWLNSTDIMQSLTEDNFIACESSSTDKCCSVEGSASSAVTCSCCFEKKSSVCTYKVEASLGNVQNLKATNITLTSITISWESPISSWDNIFYEVMWKDIEAKDEKKSKIIERKDPKVMEDLDDLKEATAYTVSVRAYSSIPLTEEITTLTLETLDKNPPLYVYISDNGFVKVRSPRMIAKGRGEDVVKVLVFEEDNDSVAMKEIEGHAKESSFSGLKLFKDYNVIITVGNDESTAVKYTQKVNSQPSCPEGQEEKGPLCLWSPTSDPKPWRDASSICEQNGGKLFGLDAVENLDCNFLKQRVGNDAWIVLSSTEPAADNEVTTGECSSERRDGEMETNRCCFCGTSETNSISCGCCSHEKLFMCQSMRKVNFGKVGSVSVDQVTAKTISLTWQVIKPSGWSESAYMVRFQEVSQPTRSKRQSTDNSLLVSQPSAQIQDLKPATPYRITVSPSFRSEPEGEASEIVVTTLNDGVLTAGFQASVCTVVIFKIICCCAVILGALITVFVFLVCRMFYLDCLAHMCAELALTAAFLCILISSSQSYSVDSMCVRADRTLCATTSVLIQYFFQVTFLFSALECQYISSQLLSIENILLRFANFMVSSCGPLLFCGWGIPAVILLVSAIIASDEFTDGNENCWLNIGGRAVWPSVIPMTVFIVIHLIFIFLLLWNKDVTNPLPIQLRERAWVLLRTKWISLALLLLEVPCWMCGMFGAVHNNTTLNGFFIIFSFLLAIFLPVLRMHNEDEVRDHLKRGLFTDLRGTSSSSSRIRPSSFPFATRNSFSSLRISSLSQYKKEAKKAEMANFVLPGKKENANDNAAWHR